MSKLAELLSKGKSATLATTAAATMSSPAPPTSIVTSALRTATNDAPIIAVPTRSGLTLNKPAPVPGSGGGIAGFGKPLSTQTSAAQTHAEWLEVVEADLANMKISLQNDVIDWPVTAYADIDTDTVEGKLQAMLNEVQRVLLTDDVSTVMHRTMQFLHENPALTNTLLPDDIGLLVTALESSYGVVINTKTENRAKKSKSGAVASDLANAFADLQF